MEIQKIYTSLDGGELLKKMMVIPPWQSVWTQPIKHPVSRTLPEVQAPPIAAEILLTFPIEIATPPYFGMSSNGTLSTTLRGNDGTFSAKGTDFFSLGSDGTFMDNEYMGTFARAPFLGSHTMDGSSSFPGQEYEATTHARAPLLHSYTMDGLFTLAEY